MKVDGGKLSEVGFKYLGVPYSQMDCQAFVETCLEDCGNNTNLAGSNAWYREVMRHGLVCTPEQCRDKYGNVPPGAFLFILKHDGNEPAKYQGDGIGNASHIGICTGDRGEGAIHSSSSKGCVCESKFKGKTIPNGGWNMIGLWDEVNYSGTDSPAEPTQPTEPETATVWAENGKPVNLRKRPSIVSALVDRVPCGQTVVIEKPSPDWCKIDWNGKKGYMMTRFLSVDEPVPGVTYGANIHGLTLEESQRLLAQFPNAEIWKERG